MKRNTMTTLRTTLATVLVALPLAFASCAPETVLAQSGANIEKSPTVKMTLAVSQSMGVEAVRRLVREAARVGARVVVRGVAVPEDVRAADWFALTREEQTRHKAAIRAGLAQLGSLSVAGAGVAIDPAFFTRHGIDAVPVFVFDAVDEKAIDGKAVDGMGDLPCRACERNETSSRTYRVRGDVTLAWALRYAADRSADGADRAALTRLADRLGAR